MILKKIGFDFDSGRVDIGSHPTILASSPDDVRVVNSFAEDDFWGGIFNILHCGGRGIYQQSNQQGADGNAACRGTVVRGRGSDRQAL